MKSLSGIGSGKAEKQKSHQDDDTSLVGLIDANISTENVKAERQQFATKAGDEKYTQKRSVETIEHREESRGLQRSTFAGSIIESFGGENCVKDKQLTSMLKSENITPMDRCVVWYFSNINKPHDVWLMIDHICRFRQSCIRLGLIQWASRVEVCMNLVMQELIVPKLSGDESSPIQLIFHLLPRTKSPDQEEKEIMDSWMECCRRFKECRKFGLSIPAEDKKMFAGLCMRTSIVYQKPTVPQTQGRLVGVPAETTLASSSSSSSSASEQPLGNTFFVPTHAVVTPLTQEVVEFKPAPASITNLIRRWRPELPPDRQFARKRLTEHTRKKDLITLRKEIESDKSLDSDKRDEAMKLILKELHLAYDEQFKEQKKIAEASGDLKKQRSVINEQSRVFGHSFNPTPHLIAIDSKITEEKFPTLFPRQQQSRAASAAASSSAVQPFSDDDEADSLEEDDFEDETSDAPASADSVHPSKKMKK